jgi:hypothetical protein
VAAARTQEDLGDFGFARRSTPGQRGADGCVLTDAQLWVEIDDRHPVNRVHVALFRGRPDGPGTASCAVRVLDPHAAAALVERGHDHHS